MTLAPIHKEHRFEFLGHAGPLVIMHGVVHSSMPFEVRQSPDDPTTTQFQVVSPHGGTCDLFTETRFPFVFKRTDTHNIAIHDCKGRSFVRFKRRQPGLSLYQEGYRGKKETPFRVYKKALMVDGIPIWLRPRTPLVPWSNWNRVYRWEFSGFIESIRMRDDTCLLVKDSLYKKVKVRVQDRGIIAFTANPNKLAMEIKDQGMADMRFCRTHMADVILRHHAWCKGMVVEKKTRVEVNDDAVGQFYSEGKDTIKAKVHGRGKLLTS
jgi:hypothetical protein